MKKVITIGEKTYALRFDEFDEDVEIDELLKIDYSNLLGEMITFPVIVNRFGTMLAEAESKVSECRLAMDVFEAKTKEKIRVELTEASGKNPTVEALNNALLSNNSYSAMRKRYIEAQKTRDYINSIFWSCKDKSDKINALLKNSEITLEASQISDTTVNGISIKNVKNFIN